MTKARGAGSSFGETSQRGGVTVQAERSEPLSPTEPPADPVGPISPGSALDEATLVARAREGDLGAYEELVRRHQQRIYQLGLRMTRSHADAEDITQEVFLTAWRRLPQLRDDDAFAGWLYRAAARRCLNTLARTRPTTELVEASAPPAADPAGDPERSTVTGGQMAALQDALSELRPNQRAVWLLREVHGRSYEEIATVIGCTPQAVRGRLARARIQLAEVMAPWR